MGASLFESTKILFGWIEDIFSMNGESLGNDVKFQIHKPYKIRWLIFIEV